MVPAGKPGSERLSLMSNGYDGSVCDDSRESPASFRTNRLQHNRAGLCRHKLAAIRYFQATRPYDMDHDPWINATDYYLMVRSGKPGPRSHLRTKRSFSMKSRLLLPVSTTDLLRGCRLCGPAGSTEQGALLKNGDVNRVCGLA